MDILEEERLLALPAAAWSRTSLRGSPGVQRRRRRWQESTIILYLEQTAIVGPTAAWKLGRGEEGEGGGGGGVGSQCLGKPVRVKVVRVWAFPSSPSRAELRLANV